jgi:transcriptional regulator with XRE-family HTH domain
LGKRGRKEITFTEQQLRQIEAMAGYGLTREQIASAMGVSVSLLDHNAELKQVITRGRYVAIAKAAQTAYQMATKDKNADMLKFWLRTRARWRDWTREDDLQEKEDDLLSKVPPPVDDSRE